MHKTLKYCTFEKKKIRRLDNSIHLVTRLFTEICNEYQLKLCKPRFNRKTSDIFRNHQRSREDQKRETFKVEKVDSTTLIVKNLSKHEYKIVLAEPAEHECYLACVWCGFCVHTFQCSCFEKSSKGSFCVHLHMLSTVHELLPPFEKPTNRHFDFVYKVVQSSNPTQKLCTLFPSLKPSSEPQFAIESTEYCPLNEQFEVETSNDDPVATSNIQEVEMHGSLTNFDIPDNHDISDVHEFPDAHELLENSEDGVSNRDKNKSLKVSTSESDQDIAEKRRLALQNARRMLSTYENYLTEFENSPSDQNNILPVNELYDYLNKGLPIVFRLSNATSLESRKSHAHKGKLNSSDKQLRLFSQTKSQKRGRQKKTVFFKCPTLQRRKKLKPNYLTTPKPNANLTLKYQRNQKNLENGHKRNNFSLHI